MRGLGLGSVEWPYAYQAETIDPITSNIYGILRRYLAFHGAPKAANFLRYLLSLLPTQGCDYGNWPCARELSQETGSYILYRGSVL